VPPEGIPIRGLTRSPVRGSFQPEDCTILPARKKVFLGRAGLRLLGGLMGNRTMHDPGGRHPQLASNLQLALTDVPLLNAPIADLHCRIHLARESARCA
jgi:hypothetical protein